MKASLDYRVLELYVHLLESVDLARCFPGFFFTKEKILQLSDLVVFCAPSGLLVLLSAQFFPFYKNVPNS